MANSKEFIMPGTPTGGTRAFAHVNVDPNTAEPLRAYDPHEVSAGRVNNVFSFAARGFRANLSAGVEAFVQDVATAAVLPPAAGLPMTMQSDNPADNGVVLTVQALGANYALLATFNITCLGTAPASLLSALPITRFNVVARFSGDIVGNITFTNGANVYAAIGPGQHVMRSALFTVPAGYRGFLYDTFGSLTKDGGANALVGYTIQVKPSASNGFGSLIQWTGARDGSSAPFIQQRYSRPVTGPADIRMTALSTTTGVDVQTYLSGIIENFNP